MNPKLFPIFRLLFATIILIIADLPPSSGADNEQYVNCNQPFQCSGISNLGYPFWGGNRSEYCGHQSFQLNCQGEAPTITIESRPYRVLAIDNATTTLKVVREEFWDNDCPQLLYNASLDTDHFSYLYGTEALMLYYGCRVTINTGFTIPTQFACTANDSDGTFAMYSASSLTSIPGVNTSSVTCNTGIEVRVNQTAAAQVLQGTVGGNLTQALNAGFGLQGTANPSACDRCVNSGGLCGSNSSSPNLFACYCTDQPYPFTCSTTSPPENSIAGSKLNKWNWILIAAALIFGVCILVGMIVLFCCLRRKLSPGTILNLPIPFCKKKKTNIVQNLEAFLEECGSLAPKSYSYSDIKKMTDSFKDTLGKGGYGCVYMGKLRNGCLVAVKVLNESRGDGEEFANEVSSISKTSHVNIVKLVGFCFDGPKRALIYEFMPNGSLEKYIFEKNQGQELTPLGWERIYNIAIGIAYGLEYLHRGCSTRILHLDIKPQNILLDQDFCPKISDFGLAKLCPKRESKISMLGARGTIGYIAPEVFSRNFGKVSYKSDVYSYGMLILEMVVGRKNIDARPGCSSEMYFPHWIHKRLEMNEDLKLEWTANEREEEVARKMVLVGLWCVQTDPANRPSMDLVVSMLEGSHENIQVPPKPFPSSPLPRMSAPDSNTSSHSLLQESDDIFVPSQST